MRKNSIKNQRLNSEVQRVLANLIRNELKDPRIPLMTSVTDCIVAPDLKTAKVYISILGNDEEIDNAMAALKKAEGFLRSKLAKELNLRNTPELIFISDNCIAYGAAMSKKIMEVMGDKEEYEE